MEFGRKMLEFRAKYNLTQTELGNILGVNYNTVYRLENGLNAPTKVGCIKYETKMKEWEERQNG